MMPTNKEEVAIVRLVARRMTDARVLCGYTQRVAAKLLGISKCQLNKIESAVNLRFIPLRLIHKASRTYDVSIDYLFGENDDFEIAAEVKAERKFGVQMHYWHREQLSQLAVKLASYHRKQQSLTKGIKALLYGIKELDEAMTTFKELNPDFDELAASSKLNYRVEKVNKLSSNSSLELVKNNVIPTSFLSEEKN